MTLFCPLDPVPSCDDRAWLNNLKDLLCQFEQDIQAQLDSLSSGNLLGEIKYVSRSTDDTNLWLRCDGRTIADAGATAPAPPLEARFNSDMEELFNHLWDLDTNSNLTYYTQGGGASSRGASAAADWAAGKQITLPDLRGTILAAMDDPTGASPANKITAAWADQFFGTGGAESHTLSISEMPLHNHVTAESAISNIQVVDSGAAGTATLSGGAAAIRSMKDTGSSTAHNNLQPAMVAGNYFIYTGN
jgi:hypothetical protein